MKKRGFTLFELLVSISIIAILTALATISYSGAQKKARDSKRIQDMGLIQKAQEQWYMLNNSNYEAVCVSGTQWSDVNGNVVFVYPTDPKNTGNYIYNSYVNKCAADGYCTCALLEGLTGNSNNPNCVAMNLTNGTYYCVKNQQ